jgi:acyl carrier protein
MGDSVEIKIREIIARQCNADPAAMSNGARIQEELGGDSLDLIEISMAMEDEFAIEIPEDAAERVKTVGDAIAVARGMVEKTARAPAS